MLTIDPVERFVTSSGSTRAAKLIPWTCQSQREFNRAIGPWVTRLFMDDPQLLDGCAYWSISPAAMPVANEGSVVPIGFDDDSSYLGGRRKRLVDAAMAVPNDVGRIRDVSAHAYVTLRFLLARRDLRLISIWHASFLELLLQHAATFWDDLLRDIATGTLDSRGTLDPVLRVALQQRLSRDVDRARKLRSIGPDRWDLIWPNLRLVSAWGAAGAAGPARELMKRFPRVRFQAKGLLATEGVVTIPFKNATPLAVRSHVFEFTDDRGRALMAEELAIGGEYSVVLTTGSGLWRYRLGDRVRVDGFLARTPSLTFIGRDDHVVDQAGEKLSEGFVAGVLEALFRDSAKPSFTMLAPDGGDGAPRRYTLFVEPSGAPLPTTLADQLDRLLRSNPHYAVCRDLGQLSKPRIYVVAGDAHHTFLATLSNSGRRAGDIKPAILSADRGWVDRFPGRYDR